MLMEWAGKLAWQKKKFSFYSIIHMYIDVITFSSPAHSQYTMERAISAEAKSTAPN